MLSDKLFLGVVFSFAVISFSFFIFIPFCPFGSINLYTFISIDSSPLFFGKKSVVFAQNVRFSELFFEY